MVKHSIGFRCQCLFTNFIQQALHEFLLFSIAFELLTHHLFRNGNRKVSYSLADVAQCIFFLYDNLFLGLLEEFCSFSLCLFTCLPHHAVAIALAWLMISA